MKLEIKEVGNYITVAEFNNGFSHIAIDDHCYLLLNDKKPSYHIFDEALEVLKQLPNNPDDYEPYREYLKSIGL